MGYLLRTSRVVLDSKFLENYLGIWLNLFVFNKKLCKISGKKSLQVAHEQQKFKIIHMLHYIHYISRDEHGPIRTVVIDVT